VIKFKVPTTGLRLNAAGERLRAYGETVAKFVCIEAAKIARDEHRYTNRTGKLERNTKANTQTNPPQLEARTAYAQYVDANPRYEFMRSSIEKAIQRYTRKRLWLRINSVGL
jgi:hypothetical protein